MVSGNCAAVRRFVGADVKLHLGVMDIPYENENTTTGDVAEILEGKYRIMQTFFDRHGEEIAQMMSNDLAAGLENMLAGAPLPADPSRNPCHRCITSLSLSLITRR